MKGLFPMEISNALRSRLLFVQADQSSITSWDGLGCDSDAVINLNPSRSDAIANSIKLTTRAEVILR